MGLSVDKVYRFVQFVSNKESRGWISPEEFNIAAELAQIAVYSKLEAHFLQTKVILNDLRPFMKVSGDISPSAGICSYPSDMRHYIRGWMSADYTPITELTQAEMADAMTSQIVQPTASYPAGVQRGAGLEIFPNSITGYVKIEYLAGLTAPEWAYTVSVSGRPEYDSINSVDFGFDDLLFPEIAANILLHVGINLSEDQVAQYGMAFNSQQ